MPKIVEDSVREFMSEKYGLKETIVEEKDYEIDACLLKFNRPEIAIEIKWKKVTEKDILKSERNLQKLEAKKKLIFVPDKRNLSSNLKIVDIQDIQDLIFK